VEQVQEPSEVRGVGVLLHCHFLFSPFWVALPVEFYSIATDRQSRNFLGVSQ
jgi:hypothetical protein